MQTTSQFFCATKHVVAIFMKTVHCFPVCFPYDACSFDLKATCLPLLRCLTLVVSRSTFCKLPARKRKFLPLTVALLPRRRRGLYCGLSIGHQAARAHIDITLVRPSSFSWRGLTWWFLPKRGCKCHAAARRTNCPSLQKPIFCQPPEPPRKKEKKIPAHFDHLLLYT